MSMEVGASLRKPPAQVWIAEIQETMALLGGIQAVINPAQYRAGIACIESITNNPSQIAKSENLKELLVQWSSPFNVISVMNNRDSPLHRDNGGGYSMMDVLTSVGEYINCRFSVPGLAVEFWNRLGLVITLSRRVVRHRASAEGERLCIAQYSRETIFEELQIPEPDWTSIDNLIHDIVNN